MRSIVRYRCSAEPGPTTEPGPRPLARADGPGQRHHAQGGALRRSGTRPKNTRYVNPFTGPCPHRASVAPWENPGHAMTMAAFIFIRSRQERAMARQDSPGRPGDGGDRRDGFPTLEVGFAAGSGSGDCGREALSIVQAAVCESLSATGGTAASPLAGRISVPLPEQTCKRRRCSPTVRLQPSLAVLRIIPGAPAPNTGPCNARAAAGFIWISSNPRPPR